MLLAVADFDWYEQIQKLDRNVLRISRKCVKPDKLLQIHWKQFYSTAT